MISSEQRMRELAARQRIRDLKERDKALSESFYEYQMAQLELSLERVKPTSDEAGEALRESNRAGYLCWVAAKAKRARKREKNLRLRIAQEEKN